MASGPPALPCQPSDASIASMGRNLAGMVPLLPFPLPFTQFLKPFLLLRGQAGGAITRQGYPRRAPTSYRKNLI